MSAVILFPLPVILNQTPAESVCGATQAIDGYTGSPTVDPEVDLELGNSTEEEIPVDAEETPNPGKNGEQAQDFVEDHADDTSVAVRECPICFDEPSKKNVARCFLPCGHMVCGTCHYTCAKHN